MSLNSILLSVFFNPFVIFCANSQVLNFDEIALDFQYIYIFLNKILIFMMNNTQHLFYGYFSMSTNHFFASNLTASNYDKLSIKECNDQLNLYWNLYVVPAYNNSIKIISNSKDQKSNNAAIDSYVNAVDSFINTHVDAAKHSIHRRGGKTGGDFHYFILDYKNQTLLTKEHDIQEMQTRITLEDSPAFEKSPLQDMAIVSLFDFDSQEGNELFKI